jgi:hypothetical protein
MRWQSAADFSVSRLIPHSPFRIPRFIGIGCWHLDLLWMLDAWFLELFFSPLANRTKPDESGFTGFFASPKPDETGPPSAKVRPYRRLNPMVRKTAMLWSADSRVQTPCCRFARGRHV